MVNLHTLLLLALRTQTVECTEGEYIYGNRELPTGIHVCGDPDQRRRRIQSFVHSQAEKKISAHLTNSSLRQEHEEAVKKIHRWRREAIMRDERVPWT